MIVPKPKSYRSDIPEEWFRNLLNQMVNKYERGKYPFYLYGEIYLVYNIENGHLWFNYEKIYLIFKEKHGFDYQRMRMVIKTVFEQHHSLTGVIPYRGSPVNCWI